jgi:hypothetical protein
MHQSGDYRNDSWNETKEGANNTREASLPRPIGVKGYRIDFQPDPDKPDKVMGALTMIGSGHGDDIYQIFDMLKEMEVNIESGFETFLQDAGGAIRLNTSSYLFTTTSANCETIIREIDMRTCDIIEPGDPLPQGRPYELTITTTNDRPGIAFEILTILKKYDISRTTWSIHSIELPGEGRSIRAVQIFFKLLGQEDNIHQSIDDIRFIGRGQGWKIETNTAA